MLFEQAAWLKILSGVAFLLASVPIFFFCVEQIKTRIRRIRDAERDRIARDLHDTLLTGVQTLLFRLQSWAMDVEVPTNRRDEILAAVGQANALVVEGRDRIIALRRTKLERMNLVEALGEIGRTMSGGEAPEFRVTVFGEQRPLLFETGQQLSDIVREATRNACRHAGCSVIAVSVDYGEQFLRVTISDDGCGIDPAIVNSDDRSRHFGLLGMSERAKQLRARLFVGPNENAGTKICVAVPAHVVFLRVPKAVASPRGVIHKVLSRTEC